jgi:hypothetical protein
MAPETSSRRLRTPRPFALEPGAGERIWFTNAEMTLKATAAATDGHLCLIETYAPAGHGPPMHVHHDDRRRSGAPARRADRRRPAQARERALQRRDRRAAADALTP